MEWSWRIWMIYIFAIRRWYAGQFLRHGHCLRLYLMSWSIYFDAIFYRGSRAHTRRYLRVWRRRLAGHNFIALFPIQYNLKFRPARWWALRRTTMAHERPHGRLRCFSRLLWQRFRTNRKYRHAWHNYIECFNLEFIISRYICYINLLYISPFSFNAEKIPSHTLIESDMLFLDFRSFALPRRYIAIYFVEN